MSSCINLHWFKLDLTAAPFWWLPLVRQIQPSDPFLPNFLRVLTFEWFFDASSAWNPDFQRGHHWLINTIYLWPIKYLFQRKDSQPIIFQPKRHHAFAISASLVKGTLRRFAPLTQACQKWPWKHAAFVWKKLFESVDCPSPYCYQWKRQLTR